ncbi:MAG: DUF4147 domain-containing protein [Acidimicrobiia bacterium]|nr:DUF4147 domain-containing protein [Acidimicrobiia bacterium]
MNRTAAYEFLESCFLKGVAAVDPEASVVAHLDVSTIDVPPIVLALGKAAPAMTRGVAAALGLDRLEGVAVSNYEADVPTGLEFIVGNHPVPGYGSARGGRALLARAHQLSEDDLAIVLISGGGSALAEVPVSGLSLDDIAATNEVLLRCGADIEQTNVIRRRLSSFKGGGLAAAIAPARMITLVISDVVGDALQTIASGPTIRASDTADAAMEAVTALGIADQLPPPVLEILRRPLPEVGAEPEQEIKVIASGSVAAHAAAVAAEQGGFPATVVDSRLVGDVAAAAGEVLQRAIGSVSVFAGETTVNVVGRGIGGRNHEAALVAATLIENRPDTFFLAAGTDGIDGTTTAAGAIVDGTTLARARALGLNPVRMLDDNDSGSLFAALGDQIVIGPTGTNVGDLWIVLRTS